MLPKAVILSLAVGGLLVIVACLGLVLAIPDMAAAVSGKDTNPIATTLEHAYGSGAGRTLLVALAIGFTSSMIAVQTAVTRAIWASARDRLLPGTRLLGRLSGRENLPRYAIGLTIVIAGALIFAGASKVFALLVSFSAFGFILSYYLPIVALGYKQWRGQSPTRRRVGSAVDPPGHRRRRGLADAPRSSTCSGPGRSTASGTSTGASSS